MFVLSFEGGLGNQLFQYIFGRYMEERFHQDIMYDISNYYFDKRETRDFWMEDFNINSNWVKAPLVESRIKRYGLRYFLYLAITWPYLKLDKFLRSKKEDNPSRKSLAYGYQFLINKIGFYRIHYNIETPFYKSWFRTSYIRGQWMRKEIVEDMREIAKKELQVIRPLNDNEKIILREIEGCTSVAVHIRRGDYVKLGMISCDMPYYLKCMKKINEMVESPCFFVFSDEIEWVKNEMEKYDDSKKYCIRYIDGDHAPTVDMKLMYSCRHFIMSNSTFSWWGGYLGNADDKIVLTPKKWWKGAKVSCAYVLDEWIEIDN